MSEKLLVQREGHITTLTINRPEIRNAVDPETMIAIREAVEACEDDGTRVIVLTGAGGAFSSGADIKAALSMGITPEKAYQALTEAYAPAIQAIHRSRCPVIAAVDGIAAGIGLDLALVCDLRLASERAAFAELFINVGLVPDGGGTYTLPRLVGMGRALELIFTGERIDAHRAYEIGLVNRVYPTETFADEVRAFAAMLAEKSPLALARAKRAVRESLNATLEEAMAREAQFQYEIFNSEDGFEGFIAFLEKRKPRWKGR